MKRPYCDTIRELAVGAGISIATAIAYDAVVAVVVGALFLVCITWGHLKYRWGAEDMHDEMSEIAADGYLRAMRAENLMSKEYLDRRAAAPWN